MKIKDMPNINLRIRTETHKKLKLVSSLTDATMMQIVSDAIDQYLKQIDFDKLYQKRLDEIK